jgi:hypothetical protein
MSVDYEVGKSSSTSGGLSGSAESSPGGVSYTAGTGISISAQVISAEVTKADLDAVSKTATAANTAVSNMSASIVALQEADTAQNTAITKAQGTADAAKSAAGTAQTTADGAKSAAVAAQTTATSASVRGVEVIQNPMMLKTNDDGWDSGVMEAADAPVAVPADFKTCVKLTTRGHSAKKCFVKNITVPRTYLVSVWACASDKAVKPMYAGLHSFAVAGDKESWQNTVRVNPSDALNKWVFRQAYVTVPTSTRGFNPWLLIDGSAAAGECVGWWVTAMSIRDVTDSKPAADAAAAAQTTADTAIQSVVGNPTLTATQTGTTVKLGLVAASQSAAGSMSAADKKKLDGITEGANKYVLPAATTTALGGVKPDGRTITISADGTITAQSDDVAAAFLAAYPIGSTYKTISPTNPAATYGGTWVEVDSLDYFTYERKA